MSTPDDDARLIADMAQELERHRELDLRLRAVSALELAGLIQLALRHPGVSANQRRTAATFLGGIREYFADAPAVLEVLRRGDRPA